MLVPDCPHLTIPQHSAEGLLLSVPQADPQRTGQLDEVEPQSPGPGRGSATGPKRATC